jgi:hypothetical protein
MTEMSDTLPKRRPGATIGDIGYNQGSPVRDLLEVGAQPRDGGHIELTHNGCHWVPTRSEGVPGPTPDEFRVAALPQMGQHVPSDLFDLPITL